MLETQSYTMSGLKQQGMRLFHVSGKWGRKALEMLPLQPELMAGPRLAVSPSGPLPRALQSLAALVAEVVRVTAVLKTEPEAWQVARG